MKRLLAVLLSVATAVTLASAPAEAHGRPGVKPLPQAHAHNDYEHARPLFDALDQGFCSVEADIFLVEGGLLVAHNPQKVKPEPTLQAPFLHPLPQTVKRLQPAVPPHLFSVVGQQQNAPPP